ncbi:GMP synthase (glutamine-hydrolyzing), partial [Bacillus cereus]|uniref:GMP synthase (glutamine-hydrolyzing) n=1 Tax=Bacillus cereus TaxID=1396 RepID=UPI001A1CA9B4|nr:GMP synthase (glutamine-hydrolyzing) [Bacillus cereus]
RQRWHPITAPPGLRSRGGMGAERTYDYTVGIRAVTSIAGMTADWARIPRDVLEKISVRIVNEVKHDNRIVYDVTSKP